MPGVLRARHREQPGRPVLPGHPVGEGWRVTGQKVWTSLAQYAERCVLLTRTGPPDSAHKGITALFVDMDSPGITVRPIETMHGAPEFSEVFFDDVAVPFDRTLGREGQGWSVAMDLLPFERSTALWHRRPTCTGVCRTSSRRCRPTRSTRPTSVRSPNCSTPFRARSRATQYRLAAGERLGPETSIDKVLVATAEQAVFDLVADAPGSRRGLGDDPDSDAVAPRVPLLPGGDHLRRHGGDPAQHHRPAPARPRAGQLMDGGRALDLFDRSLRQAADAHGGAGPRRRPGRARLAARRSWPTHPRPSPPSSSSRDGPHPLVGPRAGDRFDTGPHRASRRLVVLPRPGPGRPAGGGGGGHSAARGAVDRSTGPPDTVLLVIRRWPSATWWPR